MAGDDDSDLKQALAVFGAPPIGYRNFRRPPVPAVAPVQPAPAPLPTRLTLQWPARSFACRPEASLGGAPTPLQPAPNLRAIPLHPAPLGGAPHRSFARGPQPARMAAPPGIRAVPATGEAPRRGTLSLTEMFRALADAPPLREARPLALPPMFRRL